MAKQSHKTNATRLTKQEYQRECLLRNPEFRDWLLRFRQLFPVLFDTRGLPAKAVAGFRGWLSRFPDIELKDYPPHHVALIPKKLGERYAEVFFLILRWFEVAGLNRLLTPSSRVWRGQNRDSNLKEYCSVLSIDPSDYQKLRALFMQYFPALSDSAWEPALGVGTIERQGFVFWDPELWDLVASKAAEAGRSLLWSEARSFFDPFRHAKLYVPIYPDTRAEDLDWREIARAQEVAYEAKKRSRAREDKYQTYLAVYDLRLENKSFREIARRLGLSLDQVQRAFQKAYRDIQGRVPKKGAARSSFEEHIKTCSAYKAGELCDECNRLLNAEVGTATEYKERQVHGGVAIPLPKPARGGKHIRKKQPAFSDENEPAD